MVEGQPTTLWISDSAATIVGPASQASVTINFHTDSTLDLALSYLSTIRVATGVLGYVKIDYIR